MVAVLSIIGMVLGTLCLLCAGVGLLSGVVMAANHGRNPMVPSAPPVSQFVQMLNVATSFASLLLQIVLIVGSVVAFSLKPAGLRLMRWWAGVMFLFAIFHFAVTLWMIPETLRVMQQMPASPGQPNLSQMAGQGGKALMVASAVFGFLFYSALPVCILLLWRGPAIEGAFSGARPAWLTGSTPPGPSSPI